MLKPGVDYGRGDCEGAEQAGCCNIYDGIGIERLVADFQRCMRELAVLRQEIEGDLSIDKI